MKIITAVLAGGFGAASLGAQLPETIMDRAASKYASMKTVRAEFRQTITNPLTGTSSVSRGELLRREPNLLAINFTDPKGDRVVADGKAVWVYLPSSAPGQVMRLSARNTSAGVIDPGSLFLTSPRTRYTMKSGGTATVGGAKTDVVLLTPKTSNAPFTRAKVWIDAVGNVKQFEVTDANGLTRFVVITRLIPNAVIARSAFSFTPPRGARIVDSASFGGL
ncbi:MAG: outer membrane lipoprotein chaperone LolA [Gemmatimonadota bacterium]|nr:outer membrane lipoprotein chaperone LolA [Gemmatimonadota bacterium]